MPPAASLAGLSPLVLPKAEHGMVHTPTREPKVRRPAQAGANRVRQAGVILALVAHIGLAGALTLLGRTVTSEPAPRLEFAMQFMPEATPAPSEPPNNPQPVTPQPETEPAPPEPTSPLSAQAQPAEPAPEAAPEAIAETAPASLPTPPVQNAPTPAPPKPRSTPRPPVDAAPRPRPSAPQGRLRETLTAPDAARPPSAPPPAATIPAASPPQPSAGADWQSGVAAWLQAHRRYPEEARRRGEQGTVVVRLTVAPDGQLLDVTIIRSAGADALDEAVRAMFRDARLPPLPNASAQSRLAVTVPIRFTIDR